MAPQGRLLLRERELRVGVDRVHPPAQQGHLADPHQQAEGPGAARSLLAVLAAVPLRGHPDRGQDLQSRQTDARQQATHRSQVGVVDGGEGAIGV